MRRKTKLSIRRKMSGTLACLLTAISVLSTSGAVPTMASESKVKMSYKQEDVQKIGIHVEAENESFSAGSEVLLNVYIQNNSGEPLKDGTLKWVDKKETLTQGGFLFASENDMTEAEEATPDSAEEIEEAEETLVPETSAAAETMAAEAVVVEETAAEETAAPEETVAAETAAPEENTAEETAAPEENAAETEIAGPSEEIAAEAGPAGPSEDMAPTQAAGPSSDNGDDFGTAWEEDWFEDEDADDAEIEGPYLDEEGNICNIDLAPGEIFTVQFAGTIDEDIYGLRNRDIRFTFGARKPNGKRLSNNVKFQFNTGLMTMLPVEFEDGNLVETNEENTMTLRLGLDDIEYMFEEIEKEKEDEATPSEATPSETEKEFTAAEVVKPEDEATPSEASKATPSEAEEAQEEIAAAEEEEEENEATPSEAKKEEDEEDEEDDDENNSDGVFNPEDVKYSIETYGVRLKGVKARFDEDASGPAESVTEVSYRVASGTEPGLYFGTVTASVRYNGNTYKSVQGFHINVTGEGQMALRGKLGDAEIIVSGEPSSFGAEDHEILSLQVTEVPVEKEEMISEAMEKKAEETGAAVEKMKAMDIKVIADGEVKELCGPVTVTFAGLKLEEVEQSAAQKEEKSLVQKTATLFSDSAEATASEAAKADSSTEVWHLDEDAVEMTDMESYINDDGDVVMETDHFSIFILVELETSNLKDVRFEHWANINVLGSDTDESKNKAKASTNNDDLFDYSKSVVKTRTVATEIYSSDLLPLTTGTNKKIEDLSKVSLSATKQGSILNYTVEKVWITTEQSYLGKQPDEWKSGKYVVVSGDASVKITASGVEITKGSTVTKLTGNPIIRIWYTENGATSPLWYSNSTKFYDHNVTDGRVYSSRLAYPYADGTTQYGYLLGYQVNPKSINSKYTYMYSAAQGANYGLEDAANGKPIVGVGQIVSGNKSSWAKNKWNSQFINVGNGTNGDKIVTGLVKNRLGANGALQYNNSVYPASFFAERYRTISGDRHYSTKELNGYKLKFRQQGNTYILSNVTNARGAEQTGNLETIKPYNNNTSKTGVYSNDFWPLDFCGDYIGKDALMGAWSQSNRLYWNREYSASSDTGTLVETKGSTDSDGDPTDGIISKSDFNDSDTDGAHNFHFGMRYDFTFKIGDYTGPMNYYFRGDDDFYLFIDDELAVDIGGVHIAAGQSIDIRKWLDGDAAEIAHTGTTPSAALQRYYDNDKEHVYRCTVYFMERGGFGSCCYMRCTLPNYTEVPTEDVEETSITVTKKWADFNNPNRPTSVNVQLLRNDRVIDRHTLTGTGDTWSYTWSDLPKYDSSNNPYRYTVREDVPAGYQASYNGNTITNSLSPAVKVKVTKAWDDGGNTCGNRPSSITFRLVEDGTPTSKTITLNSSNASGTNTWVGTFNNLPKYKYTYDGSGNYTGFKEIVYTVQEMNGSSAVAKNGKINGAKGSAELYKYTLSNIENVLTDAEKTANIVTHTKFTNKHTHAFEVTKTWSDSNTKHSGDTIKVGLYEQSGNNWVPVSGKVASMTYSSGTIAATFSGLVPGKQYRAKELVAGTASDYDFNMSGTYYKGLEEGGVYADYYTVSYADPVNTTSCKPSIAITNELRQIKVRVAKWIDNYNVKLDNNDLREDEFIVNVTQTNGSFETGLVLKHAGKPGASGDELDATKYSGYIELLAGADGKVVLELSEVMPKEYEASTPFLTIVGGANALASVSDDTVTLKPGADAIILVHNTFEHSDYFHNEASAMNKFDPAEKVAVNLAAIVPERKDWEKELSAENTTMM